MFQINQLTRCKFSQVYYLTFTYSSTCFVRPHAHYQEFNNCSSSLWFYRWNVVVAVLLVVVGPARDAATAVVELLMMGVRTPETCWAVQKTSSNKLGKLLHLVGWFIAIRKITLNILFIFCMLLRTTKKYIPEKMLLTGACKRDAFLSLYGKDLN
jgi:hypothetical protein